MGSSGCSAATQTSWREEGCHVSPDVSQLFAKSRAETQCGAPARDAAGSDAHGLLRERVDVVPAEPRVLRAGLQAAVLHALPRCAEPRSRLEVDAVLSERERKVVQTYLHRQPKQRRLSAQW